MEKETLLAKLEKEMGAVPPTLKNIADLDVTVLQNHMNEKKAAYEGEALEKKAKALIAMGVGIALGSEKCILNNMKAAKKAGATTAEILEAFKVAKFTKSATVISSSSLALEWLLENK